ncbi:uncharacterized protein ACIQIH_010356 [Cyanocitta cristata]
MDLIIYKHFGKTGELKMTKKAVLRVHSFEEMSGKGVVSASLCCQRETADLKTALHQFTVRAAAPGTPGQEGHSQVLLWQAQQLETTAVARDGPKVTTTANKTQA